jgi:D-alanyl-lipoteichoic acid acyltransferase DltB (MBOAT superfamily)
MNFTELPFLWLLLAVYVLWLLCRGRERLRLGVLLAGSLVFYGYYAPWLLLLLGAYCVVGWAVGLWVARSRRPGLVLALGVGFNLAGLCYWKYTPLALRTLARLAFALDLPHLAPPPPGDWSIPFGISFYTFTGIAYMVEVYRGGLLPEANLVRFTLYKAFFPQLVAGPVLRPGDFLVDLRAGRLPSLPQAPLEATLLLARGFFKKMVLADRIALAIDPFFGHVGDVSTAGVWGLPYVWLYAWQIYFDFSGYTDIARGLGLYFGFRWPENFDRPYLAASVQDFWRRWHMTLSLFLRDYLYVPLGGSRRGPARTYVNLMATMLLGGLWHGASWTFMLWGGLHGTFLVVSRLWSGTPPAEWLARRGGIVWRLACVGLTFQAVCLAWVFFRLNDLADAGACLAKWVSFDAGRAFAGGSGDVSLWLLLGAYAALVIAARRAGGLAALERLASRPVLAALARGFAWGGCAALLLLALLLSPGGERPPFIYFQF